MAIVHHQARLVFLATPHTASRSVAQALVQLGGERSAEHHDTLEDVRRQALLTGDELRGFTVVTTVRDHFDALVTWWLARGRGRSFRHFLLLLTTIPDQVREDRLYWKWFDDADLVLRYEALNQQLEALVVSRLAVRPTLPHLGRRTDKGPHREYYDDKLRRIVEEVFARELDELGYSWDRVRDSNPILRTPAWRVS